MVGIDFIKKLKRNLFKGFAIYLGSSIINMAISFLLLPILTRYLSTDKVKIVTTNKSSAF